MQLEMFTIQQNVFPVSQKSSKVKVSRRLTVAQTDAITERRRSAVNVLTPNSITLSSSLAGSRSAGEPARDQLADLRPARVADQVANLVADGFELSRHRAISYMAR